MEGHIHELLALCRLAEEYNQVSVTLVWTGVTTAGSSITGLDVKRLSSATT